MTTAGHHRAGSPPATTEYAIVGAGIMGLSIAYQLARRGMTDVVVVDRGYLAEGASGRNGGGVRAQWSTELNIRLMQESIALCREFAVELGVNVWLRQGGYLFIARTAEELARLQRNAELQNRLDVPTRIIDADAAAAIVPELDLRGIVGAAYNSTDGVVFPWPFLWGYAGRARALGVAIHTRTGVDGIDRTSTGYVVHTSRGPIACKRVICAAGSWSPEIAAMVGLSLPTWPIKHEICSSEPLKPFLGPMVSELSSGLYCSQSMRGEIVGGITVPGHGATHSMTSSHAFLATYARRLVRLMPRLGDVKILRQWAGPYDCSPDGDPLLGESPTAPGFYVTSGFVGRGFMMAPVIGKLYAEWLTGGCKHKAFERYDVDRFRTGKVMGPREDFNIG